jgi:predicted CXXCH cytochrome family protein
MHYYVLTGDGKEKVRAVSQFEALTQSACKRAAGDTMTCITCHDPHSSPKPAERAVYYRAKCLSCHGQAFAAKHHTEQKDCTACHMPRVEAVDVAHTQDSDHRILRAPFKLKQDTSPASDSEQNLSAEPRLTQFPSSNGPESSRDLALAWTSMAAKGSQVAAMQAEKFLPQALAQSPDDPELLAALGFDEQSRGLIDQAREHYEHALRVKPLALDAAANLALIEANAGNLDRAVTLWKPAFARAPGKSTWGINLARALCLTGHGNDSKATIVRVLEFNPDSATARGMLKQLETGEVKCDAE